MDMSAEAVQALREQVYNATPAQPTVVPQTASQAAVEEAKPDIPVQPAVDQPPVEIPTTPSFDVSSFLKENFGLDSLDAAKEEWGNLQKLKAEPPVVYKEIEFPNETGKKLYQYIKEGKEQEVGEYIRGRQLLKDVESKSAEDQIKLYIQMKNPRFDRTDIEAEYNDLYTLDEENIAPEKLARERKKLEQKREDDYQIARQYFQDYQSKIELPDIKVPEPTVDPDYQEFRQLVEKEQKDAELLQGIVAKATEKDLSYSYKFNDEASGLTIDSSYQPDATVIEKAKAAALDIFSFLNGNYRNADGSPRTHEWLAHLAIIQDLPKYTATVIADAVNTERKRFLAQQKNITNPEQRNYNVPPQSDVDRLREQVFGKTG